MNVRQFLNAARALNFIDLADLVDAGIIKGDGAGAADWARFNKDPVRFMASLSDERAERLFALAYKEETA